MGWPPLLRSAEEFVRVLPRRGAAPTHFLPSIAPDPSLGRLRAVTDRLQRVCAGRDWLASAPHSPDLSTARGNIVRARDLVNKHHQPRIVPSPEVLLDGAAARSRVIHTLYVSAHAMALAARRAVTDETRHQRPSSSQAARKLGALREIQHLAESLELLSGQEVRRTFPSALSGEWRELPATSRVREGLVTWEIEARRALASTPSPADLGEIMRVQGAILAMGRVILRVAASQGLVNRSGRDDALTPVLTTTESRVQTLQSIIQDLASRRGGGLDARLALAGSEVVLAHTELILDGATVASPAAIARRTDLEATARDVVDALPAALGILNQLDSLVADPTFTTSAAGLQQLINRLEAPKGLRLESPSTPWVDPRDLALGRMVKPPTWVKTEIANAIGAATAGTADAITAATHAGLGGWREQGHSPQHEGCWSRKQPSVELPYRPDRERSARAR